MEKLQLREAEIFQTLKSLADFEFILIGGYAANSYALPRFSVDCDIVLRKKDLTRVVSLLEKLKYTKSEKGGNISYSGTFVRLEKEISKNITASVDILVDSVFDRQSNVSFDADWIFNNSSKKTIIGKTITERIESRVINADALFVMKFISARTTDIRDIFMIVPKVNDFEWVKNEISRRVDFNVQFEKIFNKITEEKFKDNLQGVYGYLDEKLFDRNKELISNLKVR